MSIRELLTRLRDRLARDRLTAELEEELQHHRALLERDGATHRTVGNITYYREETRDVEPRADRGPVARRPLRDPRSAS
jgi:hypothetical protein